MKRCLRINLDDRTHCIQRWESLSDLMIGNVGIVFTKGDLAHIRSSILKFKVAAPARVGSISTCDVTIPAGNTGMDPSITSFFQALNIPTKINKGTVEIVRDVTVIKAGDRVGSSQSTLLTKLGARPFSFGLKPTKVFEDGSLYDAYILDVKDVD